MYPIIHFLYENYKSATQYKCFYVPRGVTFPQPPVNLKCFNPKIFAVMKSGQSVNSLTV